MEAAEYIREMVKDKSVEQKSNEHFEHEVETETFKYV